MQQRDASDPRDVLIRQNEDGRGQERRKNALGGVEDEKRQEDGEDAG